MTRTDLHSHSTASDGTFSPTRLVRAAKEAGLGTLALTDHDTIAGLPEAMAEAARCGLDFIPGVEISTNYGEGTLHMLGYLFNPTDAGFRDTLARLQERREARNHEVLQKLAALGCPITMEDIRAAAGDDNQEALGRPHIARALMAKGYVNEFKEAFDRFLGKGKPAYVPKERLAPEEGIAMIHAAGGVAVLAHPKYSGTRNEEEVRELVARLAAAGLDGMECYYTDHSAAETVFFKDLAEAHGLAVTGGSDFHGDSKADAHLGLGGEGKDIPESCAHALRDAHARRYPKT